MKTLSIDLETYCAVDINLGVHRYTEDPSFEILLFAYSVDGGLVELIDLTQGETIPSFIKEALYDPSVVKTAYNAGFEITCLSAYFGEKLPCNQWCDTQLHTLYCGYPTTLAKAGAAIGLPEDKQKDRKGKALINFFCKPRKPTKNDDRTRNMPNGDPGRWANFRDYCCQDVVTEMEIARRLAKWPVPEVVQQQWVTDQSIVERGVKVDMELVESALACRETVVEELQKELFELTGISSATEVQKLRVWVEEHLGRPVPTFDKDVLKALLKENLPPDVRRVVEIRQEVSKTSIAKYKAIKDRVCRDGRVRGITAFYFANRTGRWAGRGIQVQNLARTYIKNQELARNLVKTHDIAMIKLLFGNVSDILSQLIRTAFVPEDGKALVDADFSAIEARAISWEAGETWALEAFIAGKDIYIEMASKMYHVPYDEIPKSSHLRQYGKTGVLGCGFGAGEAGLRRMDPEEKLSDAELTDIKTKWRESNRNIVRFWYALNDAAVDTVQTGRTNRVSVFTLRLESDPNTSQFFLTIELLSGRKLFYVRPEIRENKFGRPAVFYWGMDQEKKIWTLTGTFGGKIAENLTQSLARDILAENIEKLAANGYKILFHVHDEVVIEVPDGDKDAALEDVCNIMSQPVDWAPGLPLGAAGWTGYFYTKD